MWSKHDVFGASVPPCHHIQPQHLPGLLVLTNLLPPRSELSSPTSRFHYLFVWWSLMALQYESITGGEKKTFRVLLHPADLQ